MVAAGKTHKQERASAQTGSQPVGGAQRPDISGFPGRLREAIGGRPVSQVARATGMPPQTLDGYLRGAMPSGERLLALAEELEVSPHWLMWNRGPKTPGLPTDSTLVSLPFYDPFDFTEYGKPPPAGEVPIRREALLVAARTTEGLWATQMPSDAAIDVARQGDTIVLQDAQLPLQDNRVYLLLLDGRPIVRRVQLRPDGVMLTGSSSAVETMSLAGEDLERLHPVGRIIAAVNVAPV